MSARPRCQCSAFGHLTLHPNHPQPKLAQQQFSNFRNASTRLVEVFAPAPAAMFAKAERWRKPLPSGPGPGAYEAPYGAGFTFGRRWTRDTCPGRQRHQRQRRVAAPAALPGPTLLTARSATPYVETVIGKGGLAQVILRQFDGRKVAVKVVNEKENNAELRKEFDILQIVAGHPHVVKAIKLDVTARSAMIGSWRFLHQFHQAPHAGGTITAPHDQHPGPSGPVCGAGCGRDPAERPEAHT